ncbi:unnamed protein product [Durusdinium trenchii]|uniref:Uncharacterized protein n=2 Tax=Durusdinium trenchii TaxID=1381693 RepID=A0ABP0QXC4_9DINO
MAKLFLVAVCEKLAVGEITALQAKSVDGTPKQYPHQENIYSRMLRTGDTPKTPTSWGDMTEKKMRPKTAARAAAVAGSLHLRYQFFEDGEQHKKLQVCPPEAKTALIISTPTLALGFACCLPVQHCFMCVLRSHRWQAAPWQ